MMQQKGPVSVGSMGKQQGPLVPGRLRTRGGVTDCSNGKLFGQSSVISRVLDGHRSPSTWRTAVVADPGTLVSSATSCREFEDGCPVEGPCIADEYALQEVLGEGCQGVVRRAVRANTSEEFAVKLVPKGSIASSNPLALKRIRAEAALMGSLQDCPHVARLLATFEDDYHVHIVMELISGGSLQEKLAEGQMSEDCCRQVMQGILSFLKDCHQRGIAYGDVKPANFMLTADQEPCVKAVDFGCSQKLTPGLFLRTRVGSPLFMAPEVHLGAYGLEADMWSAGVLLHQLLSNTLPFVSMKDGKIVEIGPHLGFSFDGDEWEHVSQDAKDLVKSLLVRSRKDRLTASKALASNWFDANSGTSSSVVEFNRVKASNQEVSRKN